MDELRIRRDRSFVSPQYQGAAKGEKASAAGQSQAVTRATGLKVSETLQEMAGKAAQMENGIREGRRVLQTGQSALDEIKDSLDRLAELARKAAEGGDVDREALQKELEQLSGEIERMIASAAVGDTPLFLDKGADIKDVAQLLMRLLAKAEAGVSPDQAIQELTGGAIESIAQLKELLAGGGAQGLQEVLLNLMMTGSGATLLKLLAGMQGGNLELMMDLLSSLQSTQAAPEQGADQAPAQAGEALQVQTPRQAEPVQTMDLGALRVSGRDLSGVTFREETGEVMISGKADVTVQGTGRQAGTIRLTGSGTVELRDVTGTELTVETARARVVMEGRSQLAQVRMERGAVLTLEGGGRLELDAVRGDQTNTLRLTGGAVLVRGEKDSAEPLGKLTVPVVLDGAAILMARAVQVTDAAGRRAEPFDLIWKSLLPGWERLTDLEADGKQTRLALLRSDPARLWLVRGDQGYPAHSLVFRDREKPEQLRTRYAYLQWNKRKETFEEVTMYPNPFDVTGGEAERDWIYEEETQTLYILSSQVTSLSGGAGLDANQVPFSGRIALADGIGALELTLDGVICQVVSGRAFDLGEENNVTLVLPGGASNLFASGAGCAGITQGEGTLLCVNCLGPEEEDESPAGTLTAAGGLGCAGIGRDGVAGWDPADPVRIRGTEGEEEHSFLGPVTIAGGSVLPLEEEEPEGGVTLRRGEDTATLPQFQLSVRSLGLNGMSLMTREYARDAGAVLEADRRRLDQMQAVYGVLYDWLSQGARALPGASLAQDSGPVRSAGQAGALLEDMRRSILLQPSQAMRTHSRRGSEGVGQLLG